jgi:hypothetical protein
VSADKKFSADPVGVRETEPRSLSYPRFFINILAFPNSAQLAGGKSTQHCRKAACDNPKQSTTGLALSFPGLSKETLTHTELLLKRATWPCRS